MGKRIDPRLLIRHANIRKLAHEHGRRVAPQFLAVLNGFVMRKVMQAILVHNGNKKTLDAAVAAYCGITG